MKINDKREAAATTFQEAREKNLVFEDRGDLYFIAREGCRYRWVNITSQRTCPDGTIDGETPIPPEWKIVQAEIVVS